MVAATPMISSPLKMLLPRTVPTLTSPWLRSLAATTVASSGTDVAMATRTAPTVKVSQPRIRPKSDAASTIRRPARMSRTRPRMKSRTTVASVRSAITSRTSLRSRAACITVTANQPAKVSRRMIPSPRLRLPSSARARTSRGAARAGGISRRRSRPRAVIPPSRIAMARTSPMLTTLLPRRSPSAISGRPAVAALIATDISGLEVANAATVAATMPGATRARAAPPTVLRTKSSPPTPAAMTPGIRYRASGTRPFSLTSCVRSATPP